MEDTRFDGWADPDAQRRAEDEALVQRYAAGEGTGQDMRPVRGFVRHVRDGIGPSGVISQVRMTVTDTGHEICVWYHFPRNGRPADPQTATIRGTGGSSGASTDLAALSRASVAAPSAPTRARTPAGGGTVASGGAVSEGTVSGGTVSGGAATSSA